MTGVQTCALPIYVFDHLWAGYNFGDSFYIAQNAVRWVMVAVGDPLYSPRLFARPQ